MLKKYLIGTFAVAMFAFVATTASAYDFGTTTLKVGSKGEAVKTLQTLVGATPADGIFGKMTAAKVKVWQAANGLTADGVFGKASMAKANATVVAPSTSTCPTGYVATTPVAPLFASCVAAAGTPTTPTTPTTLAGTDGTISTFSALSQYSGEEVTEGDKDIKVAGFELKASKDGDISIKSVKLATVITNASGSTRLTDYASSVSVWAGSTKVGTVATADFTKDSTGNYSKIVPLTGAVVASDKTVPFYVTVDGITSFDSGDIDSEAFTMDVVNVRYMDGAGVVTTEDQTFTAVTVAFVSYTSAADTKLKISSNSTPLSTVVLVDDTNNTDNVVLMKGKMVLEGKSDVVLNELPITFTSTGAANPEAISNSVKLTIDGKEFTKTMTAGASAVTVTFDNLDLTVKAGSTINFTVSADINDTNATVGAAVNFDEGDTLAASLSTTNRGNMDVENSQGDQLADSTEKTGSVTGEAMSFYVDGISVKLSGSPTAVRSFTADAAGEDDQATYTLSFDVTANGADLYIDKSSEVAGVDAAGQGVEFAVTATAGTPTLSSSLLESSTTDTSDTANVFLVKEGETRHFTLTVIYTADTTPTDGSAYVAISSINWGTATNDTNANYYTFNLGDYKTPSLFLNAM